MNPDLPVYYGDCPMPEVHHPHVVEQDGARMACGARFAPTTGTAPCSNDRPHCGHARFLDEETGPRRVWCRGIGEPVDPEAAHRALMQVTGSRYITTSGI